MYRGGLTSLLPALWCIQLANASPRVLSLDFTVVKSDVPSPALRARDIGKTVDASLQNAKALYLVNISVGTPPQNLSVQIDTGSSDLWVPQAGGDLCTVEGQSCDTTGSFDPSKSSSGKIVENGPPFLIEYGDGSSYNGKYSKDKVQLGSASLDEVRFGVVDKATNIVSIPGAPKSNGLLGVGFDTNEAVIKFLNATTPYPNFLDLMKREGVIDTLAYSLWMNTKDAASGSILFGGVDTAKFTGPLIDLPIVTGTGRKDAKQMETIVELTSLSAKDKSGTKDLMPSTVYPALIDSGDGGMSAPEFIVKAINDYTGAVVDVNLSGYGGVPCNLTTADASFNFGFGGPSGSQISVPINDMIVPVPDTSFPDGSPVCRLIIKASADNSITLGFPFLQHAYAVFNLEKKTIAMAQANLSPSGSNIQAFKNGTVLAVSTAVPSLTVAAVSTAALLSTVGAEETPGPNGGILNENANQASVTAEHSVGATGKPSSGAMTTMERGSYAPMLMAGLTTIMVAFGGLLML